MSHQAHALSAVVVKDDSAKDDSPKSCFDVPANVPPVRGNPGPFGLLCFGMTTCMLMFVETTWASTSFIPVVYCYAAFYGGLGQFVAGILEIIRGNTFAGTAFSSYGCFWMGWFLNKFLGKPSDATGQALWCGLWAFLTLGFFVVTLRKNGGLQTIFSTLTLCFILLAGGQFSHSCMLAGGYVGFFCGSSAIYTAFAELYEIELGFKLPGLKKTNYI